MHLSVIIVTSALGHKKDQYRKINQYIESASIKEKKRLFRHQVNEKTLYKIIIVVQGFPDVPSQTYQILSISTIVNIISQCSGKISLVHEVIASKSMVNHYKVKYAGINFEIPILT